MCGIAGIFGEDAAGRRGAVEKMTDALAHRGPDGQGVYASPSGACVLGHRRLAILDLSDAAAQPMLSPDGRWALAYNGECYNHHELRQELAAAGAEFHSSGDTETVLRLLARDGTGALPRLNAMFALALWDEREQRLLLARDRFGQKPLYYTRVGGLVLFASEIRALLASGLIARRADRAAIRGFLAYGAVQEPLTIVEGVAILPPASATTFALDGGETRESYWSCPTAKESLAPEALRASFADATQRHLLSDAPLGLFLSGGIDSAAVARAAARTAGARLKTLCVVFPEQPDQSEARHAAAVARAAGADHTEAPIAGAEMLRLLPAALDAQDQPSGDGFNTFLVSHAARQAGLKVALSGLGGDELFGGYAAFGDVGRMLRWRRRLGLLGKPAARLLAALDPFSVRAGKLSDMFEAPAELVPSYLIRRRVFSSRQLRRLTPELTRGAWDSGLAPEFQQLLEDLAAGRALADAIGLLEMRAYMGQTLLRDADVMGMAHGLEIRLPFLDADFSAVALALEPEARTPRRCPKWRFVEALGDDLPPEIVHRPKQGFTLPFREWMQHELKEEIAAGIRALSRACGELREDAAERLWRNFLARPRKIGWYRPWILFVLGRYLEKHGLE